MATTQKSELGGVQVVQLDPASILSDDNIRFNLKRSRVESLKQDILENNGIHTPGEVEPIASPTNGKKYRLTVGAYRLQSVTELNDQDKAGLTFPAIIRPSATPIDRLRRQLSENVERESMSPLDTAVALRKLMDAGVSRGEIRKIFARPGGKKGTEMVPASNAWLNMTMSFLDLPKNIQEKIHTGLVGVAAAYELTKVSPERQAAVLERAEADRQREIEREEGDEAKFLASEKKAKEIEDKAAAKSVLLSLTKDELTAAEDELKTKLAASTAAYTEMQLAKPEEKKVKEEAFLALETDVKGVKKLVETKRKAVTGLEAKVEGVTKQATALKDKLAAARKKPGKSAAVSSSGVKKAAKAEGEGGQVALNLAEVRAVFAMMSRSSYTTVKAVGKALAACADGGPTDKETIDAIAIMVGDKAAPKVKAAK